jgi:hypothetical protein
MILAPHPALPLQDVAPDLPVQQNQLTIDREHCPDLGLADALFESAEEIFIRFRDDLGVRFG